MQVLCFQGGYFYIAVSVPLLPRIMPSMIRTQFQILPGKLPFLVVLKVLEVDVDVIVVIGSNHLDHLKLRLILGLLLRTQKLWCHVHLCVSVYL